LATTAVGSLAGCSDLFSDEKAVDIVISSATLNLHADQTATLSIAVTKGKNRLLSLSNPEEIINVDATIGAIEETDSGEISVEFDEFVRRRSIADGQVLYSHPPIGFDVGDQSPGDIALEIIYPEVTVSTESEEFQYTPRYRFSGGTLDEYLDYTTLNEAGIDQRYAGDWYSPYEKFEQLSDDDRKLDFAGTGILEQLYLAGYASETEATWVGDADTDSNPSKYVHSPLHSRPPWSYTTTVPESTQIPGTGHLASAYLIKLQREAVLRDRLSLTANNVLLDQTTDREDVLSSLSTFLQDTFETLAEIPSIATGVGAIEFAGTLAGLANSTDALTNDLESLADFGDFTNNINRADKTLSYAHLVALTGLELNQVAIVSAVTIDDDWRTHSFGRYNDILLQQFVTVYALRKMVLGALTTSYQDFKAETSSQRKIATWLLTATQDYLWSVNRSFNYLSQLRGAELASGTVSIEPDAIETPAYAHTSTVVSARVENTTGTRYRDTLRIRLNGEPVGQRSTDLDPGEYNDIDFEIMFSEPGTYEVSINQTPVDTIAVETAFEIGTPESTKSTVEVGEPVVIELPVTNTTSKPLEFVYSVDAGNGRDTQTVRTTIEANESEVVRAPLVYQQPGTYTVTVEDETLGELTVSPCSFPSDQAFPMTGYNEENQGYNPVASGPPGELEAGTPIVRWEYTLSSDQYSWQPILADGDLFLLGEQSLVSLNPCTGAEHWSTDLNGVTGGTPAYLDGRVYLADKEGTAYALDSGTGEIVSQTGLPENATSAVVSDSTVYLYNEQENFDFTPEQLSAFDTELNPEWSAEVVDGYQHGHPALSDDTIIVAVGKDIVAYNARNGEERWQHDRSYGNDPVAVSDGAVYSMGWSGYSDGDTVAKHSLSDGSKIAGNNWSQSINTVPVIAGDGVFGGTGNGVVAFDTETLQHRRTYSTPGSVANPFAVTEEQIYAADDEGNVVCFNRATGTKEWQYSMATGRGYSVVAADGVLYVNTTNGGLIALG